MSAERAARGAAGQSGFSLIELMVGICILSIGILAICSMQVTSLKGNSISNQYSDYSTLAMDYMENLMAMPYTSLPADADGNGSAGLSVADSDADLVMPGPDGICTIYTNVAPDYLVQNTTTVSVIVVWQIGAKQRNVTLQGVIPVT